MRSGLLLLIHTMRGIASIFWNWGERRPRALWRIALQFTAFLAPALVLARAFSGGIYTETGETLFEFLETAGFGFGSVLLGIRLWDRRPLADLGFALNRDWFRDCAFGLLVGATAMCVVWLVEYAAGWVVLVDSRVWAGDSALHMSLPVQALFCVAVALAEESICRMYQLRNVAEGLVCGRIGPRGALIGAWVLSSVGFALPHVGNPGATWVSTLGVFLAGLMQALPVLITGSLAVPFGLHITWNFFQGPVLGFPVSGMSMGPSLLSLEQHGPDFWTGGAFGPEAGMLGWLAVGMSAGAILFYHRRLYGTIGFRRDLVVAPSLRGAGLEPAAAGEPSVARIESGADPDGPPVAPQDGSEIVAPPEGPSGDANAEGTTGGRAV